MIYEINKKYYVKVGNKFAEIEFELNDDDLSLKPKSNVEKLENNNNLVIRGFSLEAEKQKIIDTLKKEKNNLFENKSFSKKRFMD